MKYIFCVALLLGMILTSFAQHNLSTQNSLKPGDTLPDVLINNLYNYKTTATTFSDFGKKLTILDFWYSGCGSCIESFPKMHALQKKYSGQLQLLMVNVYSGDDPAKIAGMFARRKKLTGYDFSLPYQLQDSLFNKLFPCYIVPQYVWINDQRKVLAITESAAVTEANIEAVLANRHVDFMLKDDSRLLKEGELLFPLTEGSTGAAVLQQSFISREQPGKGGSEMFIQADKGKFSGMVLPNLPLLGLFIKCNKDIFKKNRDFVKTDSQVQHLFADTTTKNKLLYCYQFTSRPMTKTAMLRQMKNDLETYFQVTVVAEEQPLACYVLTAKNKNALKSASGEAYSNIDTASPRMRISNGSIDDLRSVLRMLLQVKIVDETGITTPIDIDFPKGFSRFNDQQIIKFLQKYELELHRQTRMFKGVRFKAME